MHKKKKEYFKQVLKDNHNRGITLIALVITVIVLLILAAVTIATLTGENGILTNAERARDETKYARVKEAKDLWQTEKEISNQTEAEERESREDVINQLYQEGTITEEERDALLAGEAITIANKTISFENTLVEMFEAAQTAIADGSCPGGENCTNPTGHLHIGDYINYTPADSSAKTGALGQEETGYADATQSYTVNSETKWRVLGLNATGNQILLISEYPIQKDGEDPYLILAGPESYINCKSTLDKICGIYANTSVATEARSITIEDINNALGVEIDEKNNTMHKIGETTSLSGFYGYFGKFDEVNRYRYKTGDYSPEKYMYDKYGEKYKLTTPITSETTVEGNYYYYPYNIAGTSSENPTLYNLLFEGTEENSNWARSYWLASPGVNAHSSYAYFGPGDVGGGYVFSYDSLFYSYGNWGAVRYAVRPVVSLRSDVSLSEVGGKGTAGTDIWQGKENTSPNIDSGNFNSENDTAGKIQ